MKERFGECNCVLMDALRSLDPEDSTFLDVSKVKPLLDLTNTPIVESEYTVAHQILSVQMKDSFPADGGPGTVSDELTEAGLIQKYFSEGHTYDVILDFLRTKHNIFLSLSTLKRRLRNAGLTRRTDYTPIGTVDAAITHELTGSDQLLGYVALWQTLRQKNFMTVKRDDLMHAIYRLDPSGVQLRHRHRFVRRGYFTAGPNQVWHVDGYDKLKTFGVAISGCIDGFSRKVM
ncbi:hypothetical protein DPX16_10246 [Anabarilius grahami]|uniref:Integrase core domain-containing protein n=1 Tax=Anabarilius grahami TaxID=495550 RepID=A0A3N0Y0L9_ANAGA|nr:hypothetical protein DPX16_10246 [Anabarilius grahami]